MRRVLIVVTKPFDPLRDTLAEAETSLADTEVEQIDLTVESPDYPRLLEAIFASDSVQVW